MRLRTRITLLLGSTFVLLLLVVYATSYELSLSGFSTIETSDIKQDVGQVTDSISDNESNLGLKANDWSVWDDSWNFVQNGNQDFIDTNLAYASIQDLNINFMIFVNKQGTLVKSVGLDYNDPTVESDNYQGIPVPDDLRPYISLGAPLLNLPNTDSFKVGIINLKEGPLLVAARPIVHGDGSGPIVGTLIFARYLFWTKPDGKVDSSRVDAISKLTHFTVSAYAANSSNLPPDVQAAQSQLSSSQVPTKILNPNTIAGYAQLKDIYDKPAVLLRVEAPRTIYAQGLASLNYFIIALLGIGALFGVLTMILLDRLILSRVSRLNDALAIVTVNHDYSTRLPAEGNDQLTRLALSTNLLLDELQLYPQIRQTVEDMRRKFYGYNDLPQPGAAPAPPTATPPNQSTSMPQIPVMPQEPAVQSDPVAPETSPATPPPAEIQPQDASDANSVPTTPVHDPHDMFDPRNSPPHLPANPTTPGVDTVVPPEPESPPDPPVPPLP